MTALERAVLAIGLAAVFSFYFWEFRKGWAPLLAPLLLPCTIAVAYLAQRLGRKKMKRRFGPGFVLFLAAFVVILLIPPAYYAMVIVDRFNRWREKESPAHLSRAFPILRAVRRAALASITAGEPWMSKVRSENTHECVRAQRQTAGEQRRIVPENWLDKPSEAAEALDFGKSR